MQYKCAHASLGPEIVKIALGRQSGAEVGEFIRKHMINSMRVGDNLGLDLEQTIPDFPSFNSEGTFEAAVMFNW